MAIVPDQKKLEIQQNMWSWILFFALKNIIRTILRHQWDVTTELSPEAQKEGAKCPNFSLLSFSLLLPLSGQILPT